MFENERLRERINQLFERIVPVSAKFCVKENFVKGNRSRLMRKILAAQLLGQASLKAV